MTALRRRISVAGLPLLAACCRIGLPIADIQQEDPRGVGKGRLLDPIPPVATDRFRKPHVWGP
jgi:hypothetical protein